MKSTILAVVALPVFFTACSTTGRVYVNNRTAQFDGGDGGEEGPGNFDGHTRDYYAGPATRSGYRPATKPPRSARPRPNAGNREPVRHADPLDLHNRPAPQESRPPLPVPGGTAAEESMTAAARTAAGITPVSLL